MNAKGQDKVYGLTVSVYQCAILMLYNSQASYTIKEIEEKTNIPMTELQTQLKDLFNPKQMMLKKDDSKTPKIRPDENVKFNEEFKNPSLKINYVPKKTHVKATGDEKTAVGQQVEDEIRMERAFVLEAMLVRIMKARKTWQHNPLLQEVMKQVTLFKPQPAMIKDAIERLIENEYLKRDDADRATYIYIP